MTVYGLTLAPPPRPLMLSVLWRYALHAKLVSDTSKDEEIQLLTRRLTPGLAGYLVLLATGLVRPVRRGGRLPGDRDLLPGPDPDHARGPQAERLTGQAGTPIPARSGTFAPSSTPQARAFSSSPSRNGPVRPSTTNLRPELIRR